MQGDILIDRARDAVLIAERTCAPHFVGFLTAEERAILLKALGGENISFFGGYDGAERCFLAALPEWCQKDNVEIFPIEPVTLSFKGEYTLSHRDFLGTLMSLGIKRECVGDILIEKGRAVVFLSRDILEFVMLNLTKVGGVGITAKKGFAAPLPGLGALRDFSDTVSSLRLDCVVSALAGISRATACEMIESGLVLINSVPTEKITKSILQNDKITIRGKGKFIVADVNDKSKKGRVILKYKKYV